MMPLLLIFWSFLYSAKGQISEYNPALQESPQFGTKKIFFRVNTIRLGNISSPGNVPCCVGFPNSLDGICSPYCEAQLIGYCGEKTFLNIPSVSLNPELQQLSELVTTEEETCIQISNFILKLETYTNVDLISWNLSAPDNNEILTYTELQSVSKTSLFSGSSRKQCSPYVGFACDQICIPPNNGTHCDFKSLKKICRPGFSGPNCTIAKDPCMPNLCQNGATCEATNQGTFTCNCSAAFTGSYCETPVCLDSQCNTGVCNSNGKCTCPTGVTGPNCQFSSCSSISCLNGGQCQMFGGIPACVCNAAIAYGLYCENKCTNPCINNGICVDNGGTPSCECNINNEGDTCSTIVSFTACTENQNICKYNGNCLISKSTNTAFCQCPAGYKGTACSENSCSLSNCINGLCLSSQSCECQAGFAGLMCDQEVCYENSCDQGLCSLHNQVVKCSCNRFFGGRKCNVRCPVDCSINSMCQMSQTGITACLCDSGFSGSDCSINIRESVCSELNCINGGACRILNGVYQCICSSFYTGQRCEVPVCDTSVCGNGVCVSGVGCVCSKNWVGTMCQTPICTSDYCNNNGVCVVSGSKKYCVCNQQYVGEHCNIKCPLRCVQGNCVSVLGKLECKCKTGFETADCSKQNLIKQYVGIVGFVFAAVVCIDLILLVLILLNIYVFRREKREELFKQGAIQEGLDFTPKEDDTLNWQNLG